MADDFTPVLTAVGPRLRALRRAKGTTLAQLSETTGISLSTLSRLESRQRKPTLELLPPLAGAHGVALDELVGASATSDPRVHPRPFTHCGQTIMSLTRYLGGMHAFKMIIRYGRASARVPSREFTRDTSGSTSCPAACGLALGEHDLVLTAGEAAEFDTHTPHGFANAGERPVEFLSLFGPQGERMHVRARPTTA